LLYGTGNIADTSPMKTGLKTLEATIDREGQVHLLKPLKLDRPAKAVVTILPDDADETALLSEASLAEDWNRPEEDAAWSHLQSGQ
jgi:hypothetical protein